MPMGLVPGRQTIYQYRFVCFAALRPKSTAMVMADGQFT